MSISDVIKFKYPGCRNTVGETYESLVWLEESIPKPSKADIEQANIEYQAFLAATQYQRDRRIEYVNRGITEEKLAVDSWEMLVENRPEAAQATEVIRQEVKAMFPKPS